MVWIPKWLPQDSGGGGGGLAAADPAYDGQSEGALRDTDSSSRPPGEEG